MNFRQKVVSLILVAISVLMAACNTTGTPAPELAPLGQAAAATSPLAMPASPLAPPPNIEILAPPEGRSTVWGRVVSLATGAPLVNAIVRLPEVQCAPGVVEADKREQCFWSLDNAFSPSAISDADGYFVFVDVEPREYVFLLGDVMVESTVYVDAENLPYIYAAPTDDVLELGQIAIDY